MYTIRIVMYGAPQAKELAKALLINQNQVLREDYSSVHGTLQLTLKEPIKETSLIPLLRQSGIHGFRLDKVRDYSSSRNGSPLSL